MPAPETEPPAHCVVCSGPAHHGVPLAAVRSGVAATLSVSDGRRDDDARICPNCYARARLTYLTERFEQERKELTELEREVLRKAAMHETIAAHIDDEVARTTTRGQRVADAVARVGGSWPFVIGFVLLLCVWMAVNTWALRHAAFDPYPYILLNLVLSCIAALQAPIIMMSQNRSQARDRAQANQDYRVNLKAELEILGLHEKLDHLLHTRWENLMEMQETQLELLRSLSEDRPAQTKKPDP